MVGRKASSPPQAGVGETIGAHMRALRKRRRMTLEQLSELTGISVSSLSRIENTRLGMTIEKVEKLAAALGVSPQALVSRRDPGEAPAPPSTAAGQPSETRFIVDRASQRRASDDRELKVEYLFERGAGRSLDCMHLFVQAISVWETEFVRHPGEKIIYVISGAAAVYCEDRPPLVLEARDSLYMDGHVWHSVAAVNDRPAELLVTLYSGLEPGEGLFETQRFTPESWAALQAA